ncbi:hypothetical protein BH23ACT5_BH23ACT5_02220 [soil metagenome]
MTTATSGEPNARPPVAHAASSPEVAVRPTVRVRPLLGVRTEQSAHGFAPEDPYVRRYWVAAIGAGAVADLLRLIRAGRDANSVPLPRWLPILIGADLVRVEEGDLVVPARLPEVPLRYRRRFPPGLREQHRRAVETSRRA